MDASGLDLGDGAGVFDARALWAGELPAGAFAVTHDVRFNRRDVAVDIVTTIFARENPLFNVLFARFLDDDSVIAVGDNRTTINTLGFPPVIPITNVAWSQAEVRLAVAVAVAELGEARAPPAGSSREVENAAFAVAPSRPGAFRFALGPQTDRPPPTHPPEPHTTSSHPLTVHCAAQASKEAIGLFTYADPSTVGAGISVGWSRDPNQYLAGINGGTGDYTIGLGFRGGDVPAWGNVTFRYAYVFGLNKADAATLAVAAGSGGGQSGVVPGCGDDANCTAPFASPSPSLWASPTATPATASSGPSRSATTSTTPSQRAPPPVVWPQSGRSPGHSGRSPLRGPARNPAILWATDIGAPVVAYPAVADDGTVVAVTAYGGVFGLERTAGSAVWALSPFGASTCHAVGVDRDVVLTGPTAPTNSTPTVRRVRGSVGVLQWQWSPGAAATSVSCPALSPDRTEVAVTVAGGATSTSGRNVVGLSYDTGALLWVAAAGGAASDARVAASPPRAGAAPGICCPPSP